MNKENADKNLDEIDRTLLRILSKDPRLSYNAISDRLADEGHEMSAEGVRHRVRGLLDATSTFFLFAPGEHDWEIVRVGVEVVDEPDAKSRVREHLSDIGFWLVCTGLGTIDIYAVGTAVSIKDTEELIRSVREYDLITDVDFSIETQRTTDLKNYFSHGEPSIEEP